MSWLRIELKRSVRREREILEPAKDIVDTRIAEAMADTENTEPIANTSESRSVDGVPVTASTTRPRASGKSMMDEADTNWAVRARPIKRRSGCAN